MSDLLRLAAYLAPLLIVVALLRPFRKALRSE